MKKYTVGDFIDEFRDSIGDTDCDVSATEIIAHLNRSLRRLARERGLDKLFRYHDTISVASIDTTGKASASWTLNNRADGTCIGGILDIQKIRILDASGCDLVSMNLCYVPLDEFLDCNILPESEAPGTPTSYTIEELGGKTKLILDAPIDGPTQVDLYYSAFHPRVRSEGDKIYIPWEYADILVDLVTAFYHMQSSDYNFSFADFENYDKEVDRARELLAQRHSGTPNRKYRRSW